MTIVDIYCHIYPDRFFREMTKAAPNLENIGKRLRGVTKLFDLDARFKEMDEFGDYREIISLPNPAIEDIAPPDVGLNLARIANDSMAELCRKHPDRFPAFAAALCLTDVEGSVAEARRAIMDLGARGVLIYTNVAGEPLDQPKYEPIFATMAELDLPIWLHPVGTAAMPDYPAESQTAREEGDVLVELCVASSGIVEDVKLTKTSGFPRLDTATVTGLRGSQFQPATREGKPVRLCGYNLTLGWRLDNAPP